MVKKGKIYINKKTKEKVIPYRVRTFPYSDIIYVYFLKIEDYKKKNFKKDHVMVKGEFLSKFEEENN
jgi:hypothetical protein